MEVSEAPFDRVYFDSSALRDGGWPHVSGILEDTFRLARSLSIGLFIPRAVEVEVEGMWLRELYELRNEQKVTKHIAGITDNVVASIDWDQARHDYRVSSDELKTEWAMGILPITQSSLEHAFQLTITTGAPFENKRPGLRDAVIYYSVVEHLRIESGHRAVLVTQDKGLAAFLDGRETSRLHDLGIALQIPYPHEKSRMLDWLRGKLHEIKEAQETAAERSIRKQDESRARRALEA